MTIKEIKLMSMVDLISVLKNTNNQSLINTIVYEITCRMYVPFGDVTFDELLINNGYIPIERNNNEIRVRKS